MPKDVEKNLDASRPFNIPFVENSLVLYPILIVLFVSLKFIFLSSLYTIDISTLSHVGLGKIISKSVGCCFFFN